MQMKSKKWFKHVHDRPHRHLVSPHGGQWIRPTLTPSNTWFLEPTRVNPKRHVDRSTRFCINCSKYFQCFSEGRTTSKITPSVGILDPRLTRGSWATRVGPQTASRSVFAGLTNGPTDRQTDKQPDHATLSVAIAGILRNACIDGYQISKTVTVQVLGSLPRDFSMPPGLGDFPPCKMGLSEEEIQRLVKRIK